MADVQPTSDQYADEQWKPVVGYEGLYEVSDQGRVRSVDRDILCKDGRIRSIPGRMKKLTVSRDGHSRTGLGKSDTALVHRLVAAAFLGPCPDGMEVCHWNDCPSDNRLSNLRYGTRGSNLRDAVRNGKHTNASKTKCRRGHPLAFPNLVPSSMRANNRKCLACQRASSYLQKHVDMKPKFQSISDSYYEAIMRSAE